MRVVILLGKNVEVHPRTAHTGPEGE
jgi:hypothetical protein